MDSAKIAARRSLEVGCALLAWEAGGGRCLFGSFTLRHTRRDRLTAEWDALLKSWEKVQNSAVWRKWRARLGSPGLIRVTEVTHGDEHGWHVHLHFVLLVADPGESLPGLVDEFRTWLVRKWIRTLDAVGFPGALPAGQDLHLVEGVRAAAEIGQYLTKSTAYGVAQSLAAESMGRELFGSASKVARHRHSTAPVWHVAERFFGTGDLDLLNVWHEYERSSKGRRQMGWSRGLREQLLLGREVSDEEVAAEQLGDEDLVLITAAGWSTVLRSGEPLSVILDAVESAGLLGLRRLLDDWGVEYVLPVRRSGDA